MLISVRKNSQNIHSQSVIRNLTPFFFLQLVNESMTKDSDLRLYNIENIVTLFDIIYTVFRTATQTSGLSEIH